MGVTIHWQGKLSGQPSCSRLLEDVRAYAEEHGWRVVEIEPAMRRLKRVIEEQDVEYVGPTHGLTVWPHTECEPLHFEFDKDLYTQEYCKTQFAGAAVHIAIVDLLRRLAPRFEYLDVDDEGEYWDKSDAGTLEAHLRHIRGVLSDMLANDPDARSPVVLPSGRIVDLVGSNIRDTKK